jgi:alkaline phosphatase
MIRHRARRHRMFGIAAAVATIGSAAAGLSMAVTPADQSDALRRAIDGGPARNVILFLGDGMGDSEMTIARNYQVGAGGRLWMDTLPFTGAYTTYALQERDPRRVDYVTDSAASGTGWATGVRTSNGRVSSAVGSAGVAPLVTILELAQRAGLRVGNVTTSELTDATPAVLDAHVNDRSCQGPADMKACAPYRKSNGGPGSIAEQSVDHLVDVLLGGGRRRFAQTIEGGPDRGKTVMESAEAKGYTIVYDASGLAAARGPRVLGLFNDGNMSLEWTGQPASPAPYRAPQTCLEGRRALLTNEPSLAEMTARAIDLLQNARGTSGSPSAVRRGFFLQVEGASIDKQAHVESPCQQIGETIAFDQAVKVGLDFARSHPQTLIIVTADHAHSGQIVPVPSASEASARPGALSVLLTKEGSQMAVSYATRAPGRAQDHTGSQVRIAAAGPQAANVVGLTNQTDLFTTMARALGLVPEAAGSR